jgi:predicted TIM-barrel fold metal-dependent hydrolase
MSTAIHRVDVHHHLLSPAYREANRARIASYMPGFEYTIDWLPQWSIEAMDKAEVQTSLLSLSVPGVWFGDAAEARRLARDNNDYGARLCADYPGRFGLFASLPLPEVDASLAEIRHALDELKADGIGLLTSAGGKWLGDASYAPVYEELNRRRAIVYVHPIVPDCCGGLVPDLPPAAIEFPFDTTRTIASLLVSGTFSRYPDIRFIFSHGGGALPMLAARLSAVASGNKRIAERLPKGPAAELRKLYFDTASVTNTASWRALEVWSDKNHVLFGTDFPFGQLDRSLTSLRELGLDEAHLLGVEGGYALDLLPHLRKSR